MSERLSDYLDKPVVRSEERLRLRVLAIKGDHSNHASLALAERVRRACHRVDPTGVPGHVIVANEAGPQRILRDYIAYYLCSRTHLALDKDPPIPRAVAPTSAGRVVATPRVGGLHHRYDRVAA